MSNMQHIRPPRAIVTVAAENGAILGLYLILLAVFTGLSASFGLATLLVWAGSIYLPFYVYKLMRSHHAETGFSLSLPELWSQALMSFMLASLLQTVAVYVLLRFVVPGFIASQIQFSIDTFEAMGTPQGDMWADHLKNMRSLSGVPSALDTASGLIVFNIFCGAIIGFADALILYTRYLSTARRERWQRMHGGSQTPR